MPEVGVLSAVWLTVGVVLLVTATSMVLRGGRDLVASPSRRALCAAIASLGVSCVVQSPLLRVLQDAIAPNFGQLAGNATTLLAGFFTHVMLIHVAQPDGPRRHQVLRRLLLLLAAVAAMSVLFAATPTVPGAFVSRPGPAVPLAAGVLGYYLVYLAYLGSVLAGLLVLLPRHASRARDVHLRTGLRILVAAAVTGLVYVTGRAVTLVVEQFTSTPEPVHFAVGVLAPALTALLFALGCTYGRWAPAVVGGWRWVGHVRAHRGLEPLWRAVERSCPQLILPGIGRARADLRLYRRVIEIQDAQLLISMRLDAATRAAVAAEVDAEDVPDADRPALLDAALFATGLRLLRTDRASPPTAPPDAGTPPRDVEDALAHLLAVSAAFDGSALVLRRLSDADPVGSAP